MVGMGVFDSSKVTLVDPLEQLAVPHVTLGQLREAVAEVEQQGEPVTSRHGQEVLGDRVQRIRQRDANSVIGRLVIGHLALRHVAPNSMVRNPRDRAVGLRHREATGRGRPQISRECLGRSGRIRSGSVEDRGCR